LVLLISDIHFGKGDPASERAKEASLIACLRAHEAETEGLYLLGDVFDQYIEYAHLVPKGFVRFQALLAEWTDRGIPVTYLAGNHDPWHIDYFERELGVRVLLDELVEPLYGLNVHMAHGDGISDASAAYRRLKPWLRHRLPVWAYRTLLPGDAGFRLARWWRRRFGSEALNPAVTDDLRDHAHMLLREEDVDVVVMGHSHAHARFVWPEGTYVNSGCWHEECTFVRFDKNDLSLLRWNGTCADVVEPAAAMTG
jgi:UDP-2,3-diacylglucosamine hydrolase